MTETHTSQGFTLIELSIVLVIIGLIVGGILVGQDLIKAAEVRSQVSQIEKYNSAVNTFRSKFGGIPGDLALSAANQFGFSGASCTGNSGHRDGNGLIDGGNAAAFPLQQGSGETQLFWQDISSSISGNLIDGQFPNSGGTTVTCGVAISMNTALGTRFLGDYFPDGKIGHGTFVYVYEVGGYNWFGLSAATQATGSAALVSNTGIPVIQSYNIDKKIDDGLPTTGAVEAAYLNNDNVNVQTPNAQSTDSTTSCYNTSSNVYSIGSAANYGNGGNCALSFRFQ